MRDLVSIVIPCYNSELTLCETLDCVAKQTYPNVEIIIVDDGSANTQALTPIIAPYTNLFSQIHFIQQPNQGQAAARNNGAKIARGAYLLFLDSDDLIADTYIEKTVKVLSDNINVKLAYSKAKLFGAVNKSWNLPKYSFRRLLQGNIIFMTALMRTKDFRHCGMFSTDLKFYEDWDLWIRMLKDGGGAYQIPAFLFFYRKQQQQESLTDYKEKNKEFDRLNKLKVYAKNEDSYIREFGESIDMIETIKDLERVKQKYDAIWYRRFFNLFR